jgi:hypothetical protein
MQSLTLGDKIDVRMGRAEAVILFELLADFSSQAALPVQDEAERLALFRLHGALEETLVESSKPEYSNILEASRSRLIQQSKARLS